jgi:F1F0 ATPase subunit 2
MPDLNDACLLALAALAGAMLGLMFFGGLWWTLRRAAVSPRPALWVGPSFLLRIAVATGGIYLVGDGVWPRLAACLAGFILARMAALRLTARRPPGGAGVAHAS